MADEDHERPAPSDLAEEAGRSFAGMSLDDVKDHAFWETQPVGQLKPELDRSGPEGPIDDPMTVEEVKQDGYHLPAAFEWCTCDVTDKKVNDEVFDLLDNNYVEDDDAMFRFQYSREFLKWVLQPPGYVKDWHLGVRVVGTGKLVAFITGVPAKLTVKGKRLDLAEINFLCIHKKLRRRDSRPCSSARSREGSTCAGSGRRRTPRAWCSPSPSAPRGTGTAP